MRKKLHIGMSEYLMLLLVVLASTLRIILISQHWPITNSDEAIMDLMALHINNRGERPIFFYGQAYMGPIEAYIGALCFRLFGQSVFSLRLGIIPFFALFLMATYLLTRKLYSKHLALFTVALLGLGSNDMFAHELKAIGGYPEIPFLGTFIFFLCCKLALSSFSLNTKLLQQENLKLYEKKQRLRWWLYGLLGFLVGFAIWIDQLLLPYIATAMFLLFLFCWRDFFSRYGLFFLLGIIIGALPLIYYNLTVPLNQNSLVVLLNTHGVGQQELLTQQTPFLRQLSGTFLISLPAITGLNPLCTPDQFPPFSTTTSTSCIVMQGGWSLGYLLLWICAILMASISLWKLHSSRQQRQKQNMPVQAIEQIETRHKTILHTARLMLLISALFTVLQYLSSPTSGLTPSTSSRYLYCLLISTPAILWPLWSTLSRYRARKPLFVHPLRIASLGLLLFIGSMYLTGTIRIWLDIPGAQNQYNREQALMQTLLKSGITRFYSEYWTCNHLIFRSNERLICSNLNYGLQADPVLDRYQPYRDSVRRSRTTAYVFPQDSPQQHSMDYYLQSTYKTNSHAKHYIRREYKGYVIYQIPTPIGIP